MATITTPRKRIKQIVIPDVGTPERTAWEERQAKLQQLHASSFVKRKEQELKDWKARMERRRYQRRRDASGGTLFGSEDVDPKPVVPRPIVPPRGPKTDGGNRVIDDGEVPVTHDKRKAKTKVEAARQRERRQSKEVF